MVVALDLHKTQSTKSYMLLAANPASQPGGNTPDSGTYRERKPRPGRLVICSASKADIKDSRPTNPNSVLCKRALEGFGIKKKTCAHLVRMDWNSLTQSESNQGMKQPVGRTLHRILCHLHNTRRMPCADRAMALRNKDAERRKL